MVSSSCIDGARPRKPISSQTAVSSVCRKLCGQDPAVGWVLVSLRTPVSSRQDFLLHLDRCYFYARCFVRRSAPLRAHLVVCTSGLAFLENMYGMLDILERAVYMLFYTLIYNEQ